MDESHRLKEMPAEYDQALFNQLFKETRELRQKLAFEIDARKFGVDYREVLSWFDVKFLYAFNKYYGDERLKGYIINSLRTFKLRIVKNSYQTKHQVNNSIDIDETFDLAYDEPEDYNKPLLEVVQKYFKDRLSPDALLLWEIELSPPPYILEKLANPENKKIPKCPDELILEYLGIPCNDNSLNYLKSLRSDIKDITKRAKEYFYLKPIQL